MIDLWRRVSDRIQAPKPLSTGQPGLAPGASGFVTLHGCKVDLDGNRVLRGGDWISLEPKAIEVLRVLMESAGEVVSRDTLLKRVWGDVVVSEAVVTVAISMLRKAFGDSGSSQSLIQTVPKSGYRLVEAPTSVRRGHTLGALGLGLAGVLIVVAAVAGTLLRGSVVPTPKASVAVLPFRVIGSSDLRDPLARELTEETIHQLSRQVNLRVIAHREIERVVSNERSLLDVGAKCGVDRVVDATVRLQDGDEIRLNVSIISLDLNRHVWSGSFTAPRSEFSELSEDVSTEVERLLLDDRLFADPR